MHKLTGFILLLTALLALMTSALASEPALPADEALVASLLPDRTLAEGTITTDGRQMRLLMRRPDGALVFVGCTLETSGRWTTFESTPLPEGTILGVENFVHALGIPSGTYYTSVEVSPFADGRWGVSMIMPRGGAGLFRLGRNWLLGDGQHAVQAAIGSHPWSDLSVIDWHALPVSFADASARLDTSDWAVVCNPDPEDRLHLRARADKSSASLGKYYNRTPVRVLQRGSTWTKVAIGSVQGWMMTEYLTFGEAMQDVAYAGPWLHPADDSTALYSRDSASAFLREMTGEAFHVIGVVSDDWFHLWLPATDEYVYVRQDDLWEGNG